MAVTGHAIVLHVLFFLLIIEFLFVFRLVRSNRAKEVAHRRQVLPQVGLFLLVALLFPNLLLNASGSPFSQCVLPAFVGGLLAIYTSENRTLYKCVLFAAIFLSVLLCFQYLGLVSGRQWTGSRVVLAVSKVRERHALRAVEKSLSEKIRPWPELKRSFDEQFSNHPVSLQFHWHSWLTNLYSVNFAPLAIRRDEDTGKVTIVSPK